MRVQPIALLPIQSAFFPLVGETHHQNGQEHDARPESGGADVGKRDRPRNQERDFKVEQDKENGHEVVTHIELHARVFESFETTLVGRVFLRIGAIGTKQVTKHLGEHPDCDAVFFCNDDLAQGGLLAALRLGVAVPQRLSVAGFNDLSGSDQMLPPLTTVATPRSAIGEAGAQMLLALMRGESPAEHAVDLGFELRIRHSS